MATLELSLAAENDLLDILEYTQRQWGERQRVKYQAQLRNRMLQLAEKPNMGRRNIQINKDILYYHEGRHFLFYKSIPGGIEIVRVLHDSMDFKRHL